MPNLHEDMALKVVTPLCVAVFLQQGLVCWPADTAVPGKNSLSLPIMVQPGQTKKEANGLKENLQTPLCLLSLAQLSWVFEAIRQVQVAYLPRASSRQRLFAQCSVGICITMQSNHNFAAQQCCLLVRSCHEMKQKGCCGPIGC